MIPDTQGSIVATLDSGTGALTKTGYQPYGENPANLTGRFRYTARRLDAETGGSTAQPSGLYYYRARTYSPAWGRFLQPDPVGYAAATLHRGVRLVRMPTTVLAQNDGGVGVKNGINAFGAKNFLGTFADANKKQNVIIAALVDRVKEFEARPQMKYVGVWNQEKVYGAANCVTDGGSMFHAQRASVGERPGSGSDAWVLVVKKGRDARG